MMTQAMLRAGIDNGLIYEIDATMLWTMPEWLDSKIGHDYIERLFDAIEIRMTANPALMWLGTMLQEALLQYLED